MTTLEMLEEDFDCKNGPEDGCRCPECQDKLDEQFEELMHDLYLDDQLCKTLNLLGE